MSSTQIELAEKIAAYKKLVHQIEALEEEKKQIAKEILAEMPDKKFETSEYKAMRYRRLLVRTSIEHARLFDATKMEEHIDKEKIKQIYKSGVAIEGVEEQSYLIVSAKKQAACESREIL